MPGLKQQVAVGAGWMLLVRVADRVIGLASIAILARLLTPADFGLVALAMSLILILDMVSELSVELALIQKQEADRRHYDTAWTLNIMKGAVLAAVLLLVGEPAARFFAEPRVAPVVYWLALSVLIGGFENIGIVNFRKHFEFHREFFYVTTSRAAATIVTLVLAFLWPGPWALVAGTIFRRIMSVALSFAMQPYRPALSLAAFGELFRFSRWLMVENLLTGIRLRWHTFVLGRLVGATAVGHYSMAYEIATLATSEIDAPIRRAVFPGYARVASDRALLRQAFLDVFGVIAAVAAPVALGVGLVAHLIVPLMLGSQWLPTVPLIQVLSLFGLTVVLSSGARLVYLALDKTHVATFLAALNVGLLVPLTLVGALQAAAIGVAWGMVVASTVNWLTAMAIVMRFLGIAIGEVVSRLWRVGMALLALVAAVRGVQAGWGAAETPIAIGALLAVSAVAGGAVYGGVLLALWWASGQPAGAEREISAVTRTLLHRITGAVRHRATPAAAPATSEDGLGKTANRGGPMGTGDTGGRGTPGTADLEPRI